MSSSPKHIPHSWRWSLEGRTCVLVLGADPALPVAGGVIPPLLLEGALEKWLHGGAHAPLERLGQALGARPPALATREHVAAYRKDIRARILRALRSGRLRAYERARVRGAAPSPEEGTSLAPSSPEAPVKEALAFSVELRTADGLVIPEARFEVTFASGETWKGTLDAKGSATRLDPPPGPVRVRYPDADDVAAKTLAAQARKSLDARSYAPFFALLLRDAPTVKKAVAAYEQYFNDFTGGGFEADVKATFTDPVAHDAILALLARSGVKLEGAPEYHTWRKQDAA